MEATNSSRSMRNARTLAAAVLSVAVACSALADGIIIPRPIPGPRPVVPPSVRYHRVRIDVAGRIATTSVDQSFHNPNPRPMEGEYVFPIPERASVSRFTLDIDGRTVEAELLDAEKARRIYEDIVRRMKDPALLEYAGRGAFRARIFPIPPGGERRITLRYEEEVPRNGTLFSYRYPLDTEKFSSRPIEEVTVDCRIAGRRPVRTVVCPSHPGEAEVRRDRGGARVTLEQRRVLPDKDFVVYYGLGGDLSLDLVCHRDSSDDGYFMLAVSPPAEDRSRRARPKDIVFVVDTSGSMAGEKIRQARGAIRYCLNSLGERDRFNVVRFSTEAEPFRDSLAEAGRDAVAEALRFVDGFRARGGTAIEEALMTALRTAGARREAGRPLMIAFLTDGQPTIGERDPERIVAAVSRENSAKARVFVFGVGHDLNTKLLDRLSEEGPGSRTYVAPEEDIEVAVSGFYDRIASPVLTDLRLEFGRGVDVSDVYPRELGDLFGGDEIVVYGRYASDGGSHAVTLYGRTEEGERRFVFETSWPEREPENGLIARLWAVRKIGYLLDEIRLHGETRELKDEVVRLAREFGIMTPYTSMLVVEDERRRPVRGPVRMAPEARPAEESAGRALRGRLEAGAEAVSASESFERMKKGAFEAKDAVSGLRREARSRVKHLDEKTFYLRDGAWWDSRADLRARRVRVPYLSKEYFELLRRHPRLGKYFALGERVVVVFGGRTYEVVE
jgi:Ca-activated chloride channel family protein